MADEKVGGAIFELGVDHAEFAKQLSMAEKAAKQSAEALTKIAEAEARKQQAAQATAAKRGADSVDRESRRKATAEQRAAQVAAAEAKRAADAQAKEAKRAADAVKKAFQEQERAAKKTADEISERYDRIASVAARSGLALTAALTAPIVLGTRAVASAGMGFEQSLNQSVAIMDNLSDAMRRDMADTALAVSKQTTFAAEQAAEGFYFLASAGYDAVQSMKALPQVAMFAQAGMMDLAMATEFAADMQSALGLKSKDAEQNLINLTRVTDVVTMAANKSNASISQFAEAISNKTGAALRLVGKDIEEGAAVLSVYADQGRKGALAGEMLNSALMRLLPIAQQNKKEFEALGVHVFEKGTGNLRHFADIADDFTGLLKNLSPEMQSVALAQLGINIEVAQGILPLLGMGDAIREYEAAYRSAGGATRDVAEKQLQTARAQWQLFKNDVRASAIVLYRDFEPAVKNSLIPALKGTAEAIQGLTKLFHTLDPAAKVVVVGMIAAAAAIGPIITIAAGAAMAIKGLAVAFGVSMGAVAVAALSAIAAIAAVGAIILSITVLYTTFERDIKRLLRSAGQSFVSFGDSVMYVYNTMVKPTVQDMLNYWAEGLNEILRQSGEWNQSFVAIMGNAWDSVASIFNKGVDSISSAMRRIPGLQDGLGQALGGWWKDVKAGAEAAAQAISGNWMDYNGGVPTMTLPQLKTKEEREQDPKIFKRRYSSPDKLGDDLNYNSLVAQYQKIKNELEAPENQPTITPNLDLDSTGKSGQDLKAQAEEFRKALFPAEALQADIREVMDLAAKFPHVIDAEAQSKAFERMWAEYKDKGIGSVTEVANKMAELDAATRARIARAEEDAILLAQEKLDAAERKKAAEKAAQEAEAKRKSDTQLLDGMRTAARPDEDLLAQLSDVNAAMANLGTAMPQDVLDFFVGNKIEGLRMTTQQLQEMRDVAIALGPQFQQAFDKAIGKTAAKEQGERWQKITTEAAKYNDMIQQLPDSMKAVKQVGAVAFKAIEVASLGAKASMGDWLGLIMTVVDAFGILGEKGAEEVSGIEKAFAELGDALDAWGDQFTDMLVEFARTGKLAFKDLVDTILSDILRVTIQLTITEPIINAIKGMFADGGAFTGGVQYMAKGDVIGAPTMFGMAGGKLGMMGEKGPEAVMPLERTSDGRLGVIAQDGGGSMQQVNIFPAPGQPQPKVERERGPHGEEVLNIVFGAVRTLADSGRLDGVNNRNYGTVRPGRAI